MDFENAPLIIALIKALAKKGGGGSYTDLSNKPKINGVVLSGDKSTTDLGIMKHKRLTCDGQHIYDGDQVLTMAQIKAMYEDRGLFVYLEYLNIVFIPGARVYESSTAFEFIGGFQDSGVAYQCRVIINDANIVKYDQTPMETTDNRLDSFEDFDPDAEGAEKVYASALAVLNAIKGKINSPTSVGSPGKVLGLDQNLNTVWLTGGGSNAGVVAPEYDPLISYIKGDLVIYGGLLYAARNATAPGPWNPENWEKTTVDTVIKDFVKYCSVVVSCVTQDGVTVTGQTVTVRVNDEKGEVFATAEYIGQPVTFKIPEGFAYHISVSDTLDHHFSPTVAKGVANAAVLSVTLTYSDFSSIKSFGDVQAALNAGLDLTDLVGEKVMVTRQEKTLEFDVAHYDATEGSVMLLLHDTLPTQMAFEPAQALAWFESELSAGNYSFNVGNTTYYLALAKSIPAGGQLRATTSAFTTYASQNSTDSLENGAVSTAVIEGAVNLGTAGTGNLNHMDRVNHGSNNSGESGLLAWLNSAAEPNVNLPRINKLSRPYSSGSDGGFLRGFDADSLACVDDATWHIAANNVYEAPASLGGLTTKGVAYDVTAKFGLARLSDVGLAGSNPWVLFRSATNADHIKYYNGSARIWWVFDPYADGATSEYYVTTSGGSYFSYAYHSRGVVPACKIKKSI